MKRTSLIILALVLLYNYSVAQDDDKVLFIGNSYTFLEDIPNMFFLAAASAGDDLFVDSQTAGSATFEFHATSSDVTDKINSDDWDYVILQGQSVEVALTGDYFDDNVAPYAMQLVQTVRANSNCSQPVFYRTWGRQFGLSGSTCDMYPWTCTYEGMDDALAQNYRVLADDNDAVISPVGQVWRYLIENSPLIPNLYHPDQSHQSEIGAYASALTFYTVLTRKDPTLVTYEAGVSSFDANLIKNAVKTVVYNQLSFWKIDEFDLSTGFTETVDANEVTFSNTSMNAESYEWDFGDGNTSTTENPIHNYTETGDFIVELTTTKCGESQMSSRVVSVNSLAVDENSLLNVEISPNPVKSILSLSGIENTEIEKIEIFDMLGNPAQTIDVKSNQIDVSSLSSGMYFFKIHSKEKGHLTKKLIKY